MSESRAIADLAHRLRRLEEQLDEHDRELDGNGHPGIKSRIGSMENNLAHLAEAIATLGSTNREDVNKLYERINALDAQLREEIKQTANFCQDLNREIGKEITTIKVRLGIIVGAAAAAGGFAPQALEWIRELVL